METDCFAPQAALQPSIHQIVYVLDADAAVRDGVRLLLESFNIEVRGYADGKSFLDDAAPKARGCALIESQLPDFNGLTILSALRKMGNTLPVLLLTSSRDNGLDHHALEQGAACVIRKPMMSEQLLHWLASLMDPVPPGLAAYYH